jgi:predicted PurR-regulated permease PerM
MEATIRVGLVALLAVWCFQIVQPFFIPIVWGIIIAIASFPIFRWIERRMAGRRALASIAFTLLALVLLITPTLMLSGTLVNGARTLSQSLQDGSLRVPPPPQSVAAWPVVGENLHEVWTQASENLGDTLEAMGPELKALGSWVLSAAAGAGLGILQFIVAILIAGVLLFHAGGGQETARRIAVRLAGERGGEFADLAGVTVRSVARGILGVAFIQALLAGLGLLAAGVPGAGLWAVVCLILSVIQLGVGLVMIPAVIYVFSVADTLTAVLFLIWAVFVTLLDNILKPILLGRGVQVPMVVIFIGAIGGFITSGIIGLFIGAVVLVLGYKLFMAWLGPAAAPDDRSPS